MIPPSVRIFACTEPVDMRRSFEGLVRCTRELLAHDPASGALFVFTGKRGTSLKALWWDKTGYCILYKRLARGMFRFPHATADAKSVLIEARELALILEGIDLPARKLANKTSIKNARTRALRVIESLGTDSTA